MKRITPPSNEGQPLVKISRPLEKYREFIRSHKTELMEAMYNVNLTLNKVHERGLISDSEYEDLKSLNIDSEKRVGVLDLLLKKGEETCERFVFLLRNDRHVTETFQRLKELNWDQLDTPSGSGALSELTQNQWVTPSGSRRGSEVRRSLSATAVPHPEKIMASTHVDTLQGSSVNILVANKVKLVEWLSSDLHILQHARSDGIIDGRLYKQLMNTVQPEEACITLLDTMINRGEGTSSQLLKLLKKTEILDTYPQLKEWNSSLALPGPPEPKITNSLSVPGVSVPDQNGGQKARLDLEGYVLSVSALRKKNKQYFQVNFQERNQTRLVTVFPTNQRDRFLSAMKDKSPVTLHNVKTFEKGENINFNESSKLQILQEDLPFPFEPSHEVKRVTLAELQTNKENYQNKKVTVPRLEVLWRLRVGHRLNRDKTYRPFTEYLVADHTASSSLTVWNAQTLADQTCHCISNLTPVPFGESALQTTADSALTPVARSWDSVAPPDEVSRPRTFTGEMDGVNLNPEKLMCDKGHVLLEKKRGAAAYDCGSCVPRMTYKPRALRRAFTGQLHVKGVASFLELEDCHIRELLGDAVVDDHKSTRAKLKRALMKIDTVTVTVCGQHVLSVRVGNAL